MPIFFVTLPPIMVRTFHHRFTLGACCGILLSVACALYLFWIKSIIIALVLIAVVVVMMERVLHSEYIVGDGLLRIYRGRFGKSQSIKLEDIVRCTVKRSNFGLSHFLLLETVKGEFVLVEPENEEAFIKAIKK